MAYERRRWTREEIERIRSIPSILEECGCRDVRDMGNRWQARSPWHKDKSPSFYMFKDTLFWEDPSVGERGGIEWLVRKQLNVSLSKYLDIDPKKEYEKAFFSFVKKDEHLRTFERVDSYDPRDYELIVEGTGIDYRLSNNPDALEYARSRFMSDEFIRFFHVGFCKNSRIYLRKKGTQEISEIKKVFTNRLCIPIIEDGIIVSVEGRDITRHQKEKCIYPASFGRVGGSSYRSLFNIDNLDRNEPLVVCEGIMDTVRIWQHITKNVTCTYGSAIKTRQKEVLKEFQDIIMFSDSDRGGITAIEAMTKFYPKDFRIAQLPSGDPGDEENTVDMIRKAIEESQSSIRWMLREGGLLNS